MLSAIQDLERILAESVPDAKEREAAYYERATGGVQDTVIYGAGQLGQKALNILTRLGKPPLAICDANPSQWGSSINGVPVLSPDEAATSFGDCAVFVICIWSAGLDRMHPAVSGYLKELGCQSIVSFIPLFWKYHEEFLPHFRIDLPHKLLAAKDQILEVFHLLEDERSRVEFVRQVKWLIAPQLEEPEDELTVEETYFPTDLFSLANDEFFVDCGAFDGDLIRPFLKASEGAFRGIRAFEPDPTNYQALEQYVSTLPEQIRSKIIVSDCAVSDQAITYMMEAQGSVSSRISDTGAVKISSIILDDVVKERVSYMKMDIEGFELLALKGARRIVQNDRPRLAICIYHRQDHLWSLPLQIKSYYGGYKFYVRRHGGAFGDIVCYALP